MARQSNTQFKVICMRDRLSEPLDMPFSKGHGRWASLQGEASNSQAFANLNREESTRKWNNAISQALAKFRRPLRIASESQTSKMPKLAFRNPLRNCSSMRSFEDLTSKLQFFVFLSIVKAQWHLATCPWCLGTINRILKTCLGIFWSIFGIESKKV